MDQRPTRLWEISRETAHAIIYHKFKLLPSHHISLHNLSLFFLHPVSSHHIAHIMFQRQLLRSSRTASRSIAQTPRIQRIPSSPLSTLRPNAAILSRSATSQHLSRRWQSTEAAKPEEKAAEGEAAAGGASSEDALKQEIEKKNKEIIDLKVCCHISYHIPVAIEMSYRE